MPLTNFRLLLSAAAMLGAMPLPAQQLSVPAPRDNMGRDSIPAVSGVPRITIQHLRPSDKRGINVFEPPKTDSIPFTGFALAIGAAFTQQFQALTHSNTALPRMVTDPATGQEYNANELIAIGKGFNNATANLYLNAQLGRGIRVQLTTYLSSRRHQDTWVKDGYLLIDDSPVNLAPLNTLMRYVTLKAGHFEINYGDAHFRRTDNGQALFNPLVGNYILDAFTTQVGGEIYVRPRGIATGALAMVAVTNGEIRGTVITPKRRSPALIFKAGYDRQLTRALRVRLTGSMYNQERSANQTLYTGDRAGSRYYYVLENTRATETGQATSGAINPGLSSEMHAVVVNPFIKYRGLELFGNFERLRGRSASEPDRRQWIQQVGEATYRFLDDRLYVSGRYNVARGKLAGIPNDVRVNRVHFGGGWFITPLLLAKTEYVRQKYLDFPATDIRNGGQFRGIMVEGVVAF